MIDFINSSLTNNSLLMMEKSMEFLWTKQAAHLDNISNAETPNYNVKTVTFEKAFSDRLRTAMDDKTQNAPSVRSVIEDATWEVDEDNESVRMDDNGVNVTEQMLEIVRTTYQLQYTFQTISSHLTRLGKAINGV